MRDPAGMPDRYPGELLREPAFPSGSADRALAWCASLRANLAGPRLEATHELEFGRFAGSATGRAAQVLLVLTASLMVVLWPIDLLVLSHAPVELALLGAWRLAYAGIALGATRLVERRVDSGASPAPLVAATIMTLSGGTFAVLGRIVPLESPWIHTAVVAPAFTMFVLVPPLARLAMVVGTTGVTWAAIALTSAEAATYPHWVEAGGVALLSTSFSFAFGHVGWLGTRWYFVVRLERARAEAEQRRLEALVTQIERSHDLEALARGVAHEFNNLLHVILGSADLIERCTPRNANVPVESFEDIRSAVHRGAQVCRQMLAYAGESPLDLRTVDIDQLIPAHLRALSPALHGDLAITYQAHGAPLNVAADPGRLLDAVDRLVADALEAMGKRISAIRLRASRTVLSHGPAARERALGDLAPGPYALIEMSHEGNGLDTAARARLLDPLAVTGPSPRRLGLLAVAAIVRGHRGALVIDAAPGGGTRIRLFLPIIGHADAMTLPPGPGDAPAREGTP
ncbi:MAG: hypothetical protein IPK07_18875 [Deltaproteobacteria bacterium]|nr:hypothetical protein [Deltaproteobacteria bacterium]